MLQNHQQNMQTSLGHPLDLAERLGLHPDEEQTAFLNQYVELTDLERKSDTFMLRATALAALWTLLSVPGAHISVISSDPDKATEFLEFLDKITKTIDPAVSNVCRWSRPTVLMVGSEAKGELRLHTTRNACSVWGSCQRRAALIVIGAGSSNMNFQEAVEGLKPLLGPASALVQLW